MRDLKGVVLKGLLFTFLFNLLIFGEEGGYEFPQLKEFSKYKLEDIYGKKFIILDNGMDVCSEGYAIKRHWPSRLRVKEVDLSGDRWREVNIEPDTIGIDLKTGRVKFSDGHKDMKNILVDQTKYPHGYVESIYLHDNYLLICNGECEEDVGKGFHVVDIKDPFNPKDSYAYGGFWAGRVEVYKNFAYLYTSRSGSPWVFEIGTPPKLIKKYSYQKNCSFSISNGYLFLLEPNNKLHIFQILDNGELKEIKDFNVETPGGPYYLPEEDTLLIFSKDTIYIYYLASDFSNLELKNKIEFTTSKIRFYKGDIFILGAPKGKERGLYIYSLGENYNLEEKNHFSIEGGLFDINGNLLIEGLGDRFKIYKVKRERDKWELEFVGEFKVEKKEWERVRITDIRYDGKRFLYIGDWCYGVRIYDLKDIKSPKFISSVITAGEGNDGILVGSYFYQSDYTGWIRIWDMKDINKPRFLDTYFYYGGNPGGRGIYFIEPHYIVCDNFILNIQEPERPKYIGNIGKETYKIEDNGVEGKCLHILGPTRRGHTKELYLPEGKYKFSFWYKGKGYVVSDYWDVKGGKISLKDRKEKTGKLVNATYCGGIRLTKIDLKSGKITPHENRYLPSTDEFKKIEIPFELEGDSKLIISFIQGTEGDEAGWGEIWLDNIELKDENGKNWIENGGFEKGLENWWENGFNWSSFWVGKDDIYFTWAGSLYKGKIKDNNFEYQEILSGNLNVWEGIIYQWSDYVLTLMPCWKTNEGILSLYSISKNKLLDTIICPFWRISAITGYENDVWIKAGGYIYEVLIGENIKVGRVLKDPTDTDSRDLVLIGDYLYVPVYVGGGVVVLNIGEPDLLIKKDMVIEKGKEEKLSINSEAGDKIIIYFLYEGEGKININGKETNLEPTTEKKILVMELDNKNGTNITFNTDKGLDIIDFQARNKIDKKIGFVNCAGKRFGWSFCNYKISIYGKYCIHPLLGGLGISEVMRQPQYPIGKVEIKMIK